jgi:hypothetical protein
MSKRRIILVILLAVVIVVAGFAAYITSPSWFPRGTSLSISPANSTAKPGEVMVLVATVRSGSSEIAGGTVTWTTSSGTLDKTTGSSVLFTAPGVIGSVSVTITASFSGVGVYQASSSTAQVTVVNGTSGGGTTTTTTGTGTTTTTSTTSSQAASILPYLYTITFQKATMTNLKLVGPVMMNNTQVTMLTSDRADLSGFTLSRIGLNATEISVSGLVLYTTYLKLNPASGGASTVINGSQTVNTGPTSSAAFGTATLYVARMEGSGANATGLASYGQYTGGSEPYVPNLITSPNVAISHVYTIEGPETWGVLANESSEIEMGEVNIQQFSFVHPIAYTLNRQSNTYTSTNLWMLKASSATGYNVTAYMIYFQATALGEITVTATGGDLIRNEIPFGYNAGVGVDVTNLSVHAICFNADSMTLGNFVVSIG